MKNLRIWSLLCLIWMGVLAASAQDTGKEKISLGDAMPAITLSSEIYGKVTPADLKGKVVLVSLFATWCGPCQIELAEVQKTLWPKYKDNKDFKLLVIGREHTDAELKKYNERKKFSFPLWLRTRQSGSATNVSGSDKQPADCSHCNQIFAKGVARPTA